jgi:hypothetical protein|tara:strand:- start:144 stop:584 length:441 start_codon:yes stop_codon:yes gene_type:complete
MKELDHLRSMWAPKVKRSTELIVPEVTYSNGIGSLKNESWKFEVPFAFRDALDLKYEQRVKNKKPYMVWIQGSILRFKDGDAIKSKCGSRAVQVQYANPMGWDTSKNEMYEGSVVYEDFTISDGKYMKSGQHSCTQMKFLEMLIYG